MKRPIPSEKPNPPKNPYTRPAERARKAEADLNNWRAQELARIAESGSSPAEQVRERLRVSDRYAREFAGIRRTQTSTIDRIQRASAAGRWAKSLPSLPSRVILRAADFIGDHPKGVGTTAAVVVGGLLTAKAFGPAIADFLQHSSDGVHTAVDTGHNILDGFADMTDAHGRTMLMDMGQDGLSILNALDSHGAQTNFTETDSGYLFTQSISSRDGGSLSIVVAGADAGANMFGSQNTLPGADTMQMTYTYPTGSQEIWTFDYRHEGTGVDPTFTHTTTVDGEVVTEQFTADEWIAGASGSDPANKCTVALSGLVGAVGEFAPGYELPPPLLK